MIDGEHGSVEWTFPGTTYRIGEECVTLANTGGTELRDLMLDALFARCTGRMQGDCCDLECAAVHTRVVNAAHDSSPVMEVPAGYVEEYRDEELRWGLKGFDGECSAAWREGRLLSRRVYPWLPEPAEVFLEGYRRFGGSLLRRPGNGFIVRRKRRECRQDCRSLRLSSGRDLKEPGISGFR